MFGVALRKGRDDASVTQTLPGLTRRHIHGRLVRCQDDGVAVPALPASLGWHQPVQWLAVSRYDSLRLIEWREEPHDRRKLDDACCPAWPDQWGSVLSGAPKNRSDRTAVHNGPRPVNLPIARQPIQQREVDQLPDARLLPVTQPPPASHARAAAQFLWQHLPRYSAAEHEENSRQTSAVWQTRSATLGSTQGGWQQRLNQIPQSVGKRRSTHGLSILALTRTGDWVRVGFVTLSQGDSTDSFAAGCSDYWGGGSSNAGGTCERIGS